MELEEIKKLAKLARIDMSEKEMIGMAKDFDSILAYVGQVQKAAKLIKDSESLNSGEILENVMREDVSTEKPGEFSDQIIEEMPDSEDRFLKVKQIL